MKSFNISLLALIILINSYANYSLSELAHIDSINTNELVDIDKKAGFYDTAFNATLTAQSPGATIYYTLDGSNPATSSRRLSGVSPLQININPNNYNNRDKTPSIILRAIQSVPGEELGKAVTRTYIFPQKVLEQQYPGGQWPNYKVNNHVYDYDMDSRVVNDPLYKDQLIPSLKSLPVVSLVCELKDLYDSKTGIYVNPKGRGDEWERPVSVEWIYADTLYHQEDCGLRIRGGASRSNTNPKHAFRLFFKNIYGNGKLNFPLFENEGTDKFDNIDFRTAQNYSWSFKTYPESSHNTMNREVFSRDLQREMKQPYTRSRYYHLFLNGMYWGIYQTQERSEASFAESYFGGISDDYDVVKSDHEGRGIEATDGTLDSWEHIWKATQAGYYTNISYFNIIGCNTNGERDFAKKRWVEPENLIDYMLIVFYTGNFDAPTNVWEFNKKTNNFYAICNRNWKSTGYVFFQHDAEHSLFAVPATRGIGINENRVNIGFLTNEYRMEVTDFINFQPQWLFHRMMSNPEFKMLFIDRVYQLFHQEKLFDPDSCTKLFMSRANEIDLAIIAETARWGDAKRSVPNTKQSEWTPAVNMVVNDFFSVRKNIALDQIKEVNWYPDIEPPVFFEKGNNIDKAFTYLQGSSELEIKNPNSKGSVYYTIDGSDPREIGGGISNSAKTIANNGKITINESQIIKTRIKDGNNWSALNSFGALMNDDLSNLKITEIHYNPFSTEIIPGKELEFMELKNTGSKNLNLSGAVISGGIIYTFPQNTIIKPGGFYVLASNEYLFREFYHMQASGVFDGHLSNSGDEIKLESENGVSVFDFEYNDGYPWPRLADGWGYSLVSVDVNPSTNPAEASYWRNSKLHWGSPFADDIETSANDLLINNENTLSIYPNPVSDIINLLITSKSSEHMSVEIYSLNGIKVNVLINEYVTAGSHYFSFNKSQLNLKQGIYLVVCNSQSQKNQQKLVVQ